MTYYRRVGEVPPKRHTQFRQPDGSRYAEELMGEEGFTSDASLLYHRHLPTAIVAADPVEEEPDATRPNHPLLPRHFRTHVLKAGGDPVGGRQLLMADGGGEPLRLLLIEAFGHVRPPRRYLSAVGQLLEHAPYCERDLHGPDEPLLVSEPGDAEVLVRHRAGLTRYVYDHHPFDVVGWDGCLYPYRFSIHDFEPITGRVHQPPPVHQTFQGPNFVVCSFVPRLFDYHPQAIPVPYNHANVDSDEMIFYTGGDFMSRAGSGIVQGSISLHPSGFTHGPQPGSVEAALGKPGTEELAVMVDTFRPLALGPAARDAEDPNYPWTWARRQRTTGRPGPADGVG